MRYRAVILALVAFCFSFLLAAPEALALVKGDFTYEEIRGTGLANTCPQLEESFGRGAIPVEAGKSYAVTDLCLQPISFFVKEESGNKRSSKTEYLPTKVMTRQTSSIEAVSGTLTAEADGSLIFKEEDGLDFQAVTVQLPGGERVPLLFTIKSLVAKSSAGQTGISPSTDFEGEFRVPSYRTSNFLDPKGRGLTTGYGSAMALPASGDDEELIKENVKQFQLDRGSISMSVSKVDSTTGEIVGTFESEQPSETDMGSHPAKEVRIRGIFYGRVGATEA
jgi:photosystem II oxygen-evolving enhancer protein 1